MDNRLSSIPFKYYKGESRCPFEDSDIRATYWELEQMFDTMISPSDRIVAELSHAFCYDFPDLLDDVLNGSTALKAFMYDQYRHFGGSKHGFQSWLASYCINAN